MLAQYTVVGTRHANYIKWIKYKNNVKGKKL